MKSVEAAGGTPSSSPCAVQGPFSPIGGQLAPSAHTASPGLIPRTTGRVPFSRPAVSVSQLAEFRSPIKPFFRINFAYLAGQSVAPSLRLGSTSRAVLSAPPHSPRFLSISKSNKRVNWSSRDHGEDYVPSPSKPPETLTFSRLSSSPLSTPNLKGLRPVWGERTTVRLTLSSS
jgi:hypothetical protein